MSAGLGFVTRAPVYIAIGHRLVNSKQKVKGKKKIYRNHCNTEVEVESCFILFVKRFFFLVNKTVLYNILKDNKIVLNFNIWQTGP